MTRIPVPTSADIAAAVERCTPLLRRTPVLRTTPGDLGLSESVTLKLESLQHAGSFKARGGLNTALGLGVPTGGLIAASGGNHGIAVARTARVLGVKAEIFVPSVSSPAKIDRLRAQGAMVNIVGELYDDAQEACDARAASIDALRIHPYNAPLTVAGQATLGVELVEQVPGLETGPDNGCDAVIRFRRGFPFREPDLRRGLELGGRDRDTQCRASPGREIEPAPREAPLDDLPQVCLREQGPLGRPPAAQQAAPPARTQGLQQRVTVVGGDMERAPERFEFENRVPCVVAPAREEPRVQTPRGRPDEHAERAVARRRDLAVDVLEHTELVRPEGTAS